MTKHRKPTKETESAAAAPSLAKAPAAPLRVKRETAEEVKPPNAVERLVNFLKDARRELTRVTWPTRKETVRSTAVLLVLVGVSAVYLALVDGLLTRLLKLIVG
jgi:preprotein translocase subunit SecE